MAHAAGIGGKGDDVTTSRAVSDDVTNTSLPGIRILDGPVTRIMESKALGFNIGYVDIFSASWGPPDNGKAMDGPKGITSTVLEHAMAKVGV